MVIACIPVGISVIPGGRIQDLEYLRHTSGGDEGVGASAIS